MSSRAHYEDIPIHNVSATVGKKKKNQTVKILGFGTRIYRHLFR